MNVDRRDQPAGSNKCRASVSVTASRNHCWSRVTRYKGPASGYNSPCSPLFLTPIIRLNERQTKSSTRILCEVMGVATILAIHRPLEPAGLRGGFE